MDPINWQQNIPEGDEALLLDPRLRLLSDPGVGQFENEGLAPQTDGNDQSQHNAPVQASQHLQSYNGAVDPVGVQQASSPHPQSQMSGPASQYGLNDIDQGMQLWGSQQFGRNDPFFPTRDLNSQSLSLHTSSAVFNQDTQLSASTHAAQHGQPVLPYTPSAVLPYNQASVWSRQGTQLSGSQYTAQNKQHSHPYDSVSISPRDHPSVWPYQGTQLSGSQYTARDEQYYNLYNDVAAFSARQHPASHCQGTQPSDCQIPSQLAVPLAVPQQHSAVSADHQNCDRFDFVVEAAKGRYTIQLSVPARGEDIENFRAPNHRCKLRNYYKSMKNGKVDKRVSEWHDTISEKYWDLVMVRFNGLIPAGVSGTEVRAILGNSHPCIYDPYSSHTIYRDLLSTKKGTVPKLEAWMYGSNDNASSVTPHPTWRATVASKVGKDKKVPWVPQKELVAVWIILKKGKSDTKLSDDHNSKDKWEQLKRCKLTHLILDSDSVTAPDPFWAGFVPPPE